MEILIKPMETEAEIQGRAYVHWRSWQDAYKGLVDPSFLHSLSREKFERLARQPDTVLIAKDGDRVVGFISCGPCRDEDLPDAGEVYAIYVLEEYYGKRVGYRLMSAALERLASSPRVIVWVLRGNERAIRFYLRCGFRFDGCEKELVLGTPITEKRLVLAR